MLLQASLKAREAATGFETLSTASVGCQLPAESAGWVGDGSTMAEMDSSMFVSVYPVDACFYGGEWRECEQRKRSYTIVYDRRMSYRIVYDQRMSYTIVCHIQLYMALQKSCRRIYICVQYS